MFAPSVRAPAAAGSFYPRDAARLQETIRAFLAEADPLHAELLVGVIAPHAGYAYSGPVAANAFAPLVSSDAKFERVLLLGPPHYVPVNGTVAPSASAFATPLGEIDVDRNAVESLVQAKLVTIDDRAHAPEHSLEVELPFLQVLLDRFTLVPLLVGDAAPEHVASIITTLLDGRTLLVVSTDLSHYLGDAAARARDLATAETTERFDFDKLGPDDACGFAALNGALCAGRRKGWCIARHDLRNSGDTSGDRSRVVGYGAWAFSERAFA